VLAYRASGPGEFQAFWSCHPSEIERRWIELEFIIPPEAIMAQIKIMARKNGPFRVDAPEGSVELVDADGQKYDLTGKTNFALCRCGGSVNKPFCDGTHSRVGFQAAEAAVRAEEQAKDQQKPKV
jgi:CDGSH-type Zn-finger protein